MSDGNDGSWEHAVRQTDRFYEDQAGYSYSDEQVDRWLARWFFPFVTLSGQERVLDLCCGDGVWSLGLLRRHPDLRIDGVDISESAVALANQRVDESNIWGRARFSAADCESDLGFPVHSFDLIFARGLFVFNQHDMMRPGCVGLLDAWMRTLKVGGRFVGMYGSKVERFGEYTAPGETKGLPTNLCPRKTAVVNFAGGKFNHTPASFTGPFVNLPCAALEFYNFDRGRHTVTTRRVRTREDDRSGPATKMPIRTPPPA